jgi:pseudaminic acid synthase
MNLATIPDLIEKFGVPVGLSDHSTGAVAAVVAVSLGASIIEKHIKLSDDCLDAAFSVTPPQFRAMVATVRAAETALGQVSYEPSSTQFKRRQVNGQWVRTVN